MSSCLAVSESKLTSFSAILDELIETAKQKYREGHDVYQVVHNSASTSAVLYSTAAKQNRNCLMAKVEYSQYGSASDFYQRVADTLNELTLTSHRIHCISTDSFSNYQTLLFSDVTYCLIMYSYDRLMVPHHTKIKTMIANENETYQEFVERIKVVAVTLSQYKIMHIGTDSFQEGFFLKESTYALLVFNPDSANSRKLHIEYFDDWLLDTVIESTNLVSVSVDGFVTPGRSKLTRKQILRIIPGIQWLTGKTHSVNLTALVAYYEN
jgi:hypothetical protein